MSTREYDKKGKMNRNLKKLKEKNKNTCKYTFY